MDRRDQDKLVEDEVVQQLLTLAMEEDIGSEGDITCKIVPENSWGKGLIKAKEDGVVSGLSVAREIFRKFDSSLRFRPRVDDGDYVEAGTVIGQVQGWARAILTAERTALNMLQHMSGIATLTHKYVTKVRSTKAKILDTRKTPAGWRALCKYAVRCGGGHNHRMGLYDMMMIKDNHLELLGGEEAAPDAVRDARDRRPLVDLLVEVEVDSLEAGMRVVDAEPDIILLDNFTPDRLVEAVQRIRDYAEAKSKPVPLLEASGGITLETVFSYAISGVDRISIGALTHSARAMDISLELIPQTLTPSGRISDFD